MNVFDTLFPPRSRAQQAPTARQRGGRPPARRNRLAALSMAERLENRLALAITSADIMRTSAADFWVDTSESLFGNYASFQITNQDDGDLIPESIDVWVKATRFSGPKISLADDGIMHVGVLTEGGPGSTGAAFFYLKSTAGEQLLANENYWIEVYDGDPNKVGSKLQAERKFEFVNVYETKQTSTNTITSVTNNNPNPVVGDDITLFVEGTLGNNATLASFSPATRLDWLPDTFELYKTSISIESPVPAAGDNQLFFSGLNGKSSNKGQIFHAQYTFRINGSTTSPVVPSPTQFTLQDNNWKHHKPDGPVIDVMPVKARVTITKDPKTQETVAGDGVTYFYDITVKNNSTQSSAKDVLVTDDWPEGLTIVSVLYDTGTVDPDPPTGDFTWSIAEIPKDTSKTLTVGYTVPVGTPPTSSTKQYINTATVTSSNNIGGPQTVTAETIVKAPLNLGITKTPATRDAVAGDLVLYTYEITVTNDNNFLAKDVVVTDLWPAGLTVVSVSAETGTIVLDPLTGDFTWSLAELAKGSKTVTVTYTVPVGAEAKPYTNTATVVSTNVGGNEASATTNVSAAQLVIAKTPTLQGANPGGSGTFVIKVTNNGGLVRDLKVKDAWPTELTIGAITAPDGTSLDPAIPTGTFTWMISALALGESKTLVVPFTVPASTAFGEYQNVASLPDFPLVAPAIATVLVSPPTPTSDTPALILGTDDGCNVVAIVRVIDPEFGNQLVSFEPYAGFKGSVRVASGDVNRDGVSDIVVAPGRGRSGFVRVFNADGSPLLPAGAFDFYPFGEKWRGGVEVAVGNVDGLPGNEIVAATSTGKPIVNVFSVTSSGNPTLIRTFRPFQSSYRSGAMLTVGDYGTYVNGLWTNDPDGLAEIAVGTNAGTPAQVRIFNAQPSTPVLLRSFLPFGSKFRQGVTLSSARFTSDVIEDLFVGTGVGGKSQLRVFDGSGMQTGGTNAFATFFSKPNAMLFSAALDLSGGNGRVNSIYGAQGRGGVKGLPSGVGKLAGTPPAVDPLGSWKAPLRIAPILIGPPVPPRS